MGSCPVGYICDTMSICFFLWDMTGSCYEIISLGGSNTEAAFRLPSSWPLSALTFGMPFSATKVRAIRTDQVCTGFHRQPWNFGQVGRLLTWHRSFMVGPLLLRLPYLRLLVLPLPLAFNHSHHGQLITTFLLLGSLPLTFPFLFSESDFFHIFKFQKSRVPGKREEKRSGGWGRGMGVGLGNQRLPVVCLLKVIEECCFLVWGPYHPQTAY